MADTAVKKVQALRPTMADASIEAAVRRLGEIGLSREQALKKIDEKLYHVLHELNSVGIGWTNNLQQMSRSAGMKLNAVQVEEANRRDAEHG